MNELNHIYDDKGNLLAGGNLFSMGSATNDASAITAANISISQAWAEDKVSLQASTKPDAPSGDTSNLSKFLALFDQKIKFDPDHVAGEMQWERLITAPSRTCCSMCSPFWPRTR